MGFTVVELLLVIVVIAILAAIVIVAYNGIQEKGKNAKRESDLSSLQKVIETYKIQNSQYPQTTTQSPANWHSVDVRTDSNCFNGSKSTDWIPGVNSLPQSTPNPGGGVDGAGGCYLYASDGESYILSAWNMVNTPQTSKFYRRQGFWEFKSS